MKKTGAIFTELLKAFNAINQSVLLAKLTSCGFSDHAINQFQCLHISACSF